MASHEAMLKNTTAVQNQMAREVNNALLCSNEYPEATCYTIKNNWLGYALVPAFQAIIRWGLIAVKVIASH